MEIGQLPSIIQSNYMLASFIALIVSVVFHEIGHAYAAKLNGDNTAYFLGRTSLNPLVHMDLFGSVILPGIFIFLSSSVIFGWAKPVPVIERNLKYKNSIVWVALAGPFMNIFLALLSLFFLNIFDNLNINFFYELKIFISFLLQSMIIINILLAVFNLIPIPPLDGSKVLANMLKGRQLYFYKNYIEPYGMILIVLLLLSGGLEFIFSNIYYYFKLNNIF